MLWFLYLALQWRGRIYLGQECHAMLKGQIHRVSCGTAPVSCKLSSSFGTSPRMHPSVEWLSSVHAGQAVDRSIGIPL